MNRTQGVDAYMHSTRAAGGVVYTYAALPTEIRSKVRVLGERGREDKGQDGDAETRGARN